MLRDSIIAVARAVLPPEVRRWVVAQQRRYRLQWPRVGAVQYGSLRRLTPVSPIFALDRGLPIERYYVERFLSAHAADIHGSVLEIGDNFYTRKFGGDRVTKSDVLHFVEGNPMATLVADLTCADSIEAERFDCIILTQTLQMIYDLHAAIRHLHRILKHTGVLLVTSHGISKIGRHEGIDPWGEYWHLTTQSARRLFREVFPVTGVQVEAFGNVLAAIASLHGLSSEELRVDELEHRDPDYEVIVTVRAIKAEAPAPSTTGPTASARVR